MSLSPPFLLLMMMMMMSGADVVTCRSRYGIECGRRINKTFEIAENMAGLITEAGFVDVTEKRFKWPIGPWSSEPRLKEIGRWNLLNWEEGMEGWVIAPYTRVLGVSSKLFLHP